MRRLAYGVAVVLFAVSVSAAPRESVGPGDRSHPIVKAIKQVVKALGDGLTIPGGKP